MNKWEKAINEIADKNLKQVADDAKALRTKYAFRFQIAQIARTPEGDEDGKIGALLEILEAFAKRELGNRMKAHAAEKAKNKEKGND
jgi:hypothetical protein